MTVAEQGVRRARAAGTPEDRERPLSGEGAGTGLLLPQGLGLA